MKTFTFANIQCAARRAGLMVVSAGALLAPEQARGDPLDTWQSRNLPLQSNALSACCLAPPFHVTFGNELFAGADVYGSVLSSPDGTNWTEQVSDTANRFNDVGFANGVFGAVGDNGVILTSFDGALWTPRSSGSF